MKTLYLTLFLALQVFMPVLLAADGGNPASNRKPEIYVPTGHQNSVYKADFIAGDRYLISASGDQTIRFWDIARARELRSMPGWFYILSPDKKTALSLRDNGLILWEIESSSVFRSFDAIHPAAFLSDGKSILATAKDRKSFLLFDAATGQMKAKYPWVEQDLYNKAYRIALSPDNRLVAGVEKQYAREFIVCELATGKVVRRLEGHSGNIYKIVFSPDGKFLLSSSDDKTVRLWDLETGNEVRRFQHPHWIHDIAFCKDGKSFLSGCNDNMVRLWSLESEQEPALYKGNQYEVYSVGLSDGEDRIVSGCRDGAIRLWNRKTGTPLLKLYRPVASNYFSGYPGASDACLSSDGRYALLVYPDALILWDVKEGKRLKDFQGLVGAMMGGAISPDGKLVAGCSGSSGKHPRSLGLWDVATGKPLFLRPDPTEREWQVKFSPDGKSLACSGEDGVVRIYSIPDGKEVSILKGHTKWIRDFEFTSDGKRLLSACDDYTLKLWDIASGRELMTYKSHTNGVELVRFVPGERQFLTASGDNTVRLWDSATGMVQKTFDKFSSTTAMAISPDGRTVACGSLWSGTIIWDLKSGDEIRHNIRHGSGVTALSFSPDGRYLLSASSGELALKIWDLRDDSAVTFLAGPKADQWAVFTHDGFWDSSATGGELLHMVRGLEYFHVDQFAAQTNRPDIIMQRLGSEDSAMQAYFNGQYRKRLKRLGIVEEALGKDYHVPEAAIKKAEVQGKFVELSLEFSDSLSPLMRYNLYVNDVPLFGAYGKEISGSRRTVTEKVELCAGENKIEAGCINASGAESYRASTSASYKGSVKSDLYFLGFGVSRYRDASLNLHYADKDIEDLAAAFGRMKGYYGNIHAFSFTNEKATTEAIRQAKGLLAGAKVDDTLVLAISGHGKHDSDAESTYYFITHETEVNDLKATAAPFEVIEDILQGIPPRNKLFLMDTCESGEVGEEMQRQYLASGSRGLVARAIGGSKGLSVEERAAAAPLRGYLFERDRFIYNDLLRRSGSIVFSSCRGGEFSYEDDALCNGYFTYEFLSAIASGGGKPLIPVDAIKSAVIAGVAKRSLGLQNPTVDRDNIFQKFGFPTPGK